MDATTLLIAALCLLAGLAIGALLTRTLTPQLKKQRELEEQLRRTEEEYRIYQQDVTEHFVKSAELLRTISQNYRALGDQLTTGAIRLTNPEVSRELMEAANPLHSGAMSRTLSATPTEPPKDYAPSVPGGVLSENYGLDDQPRTPSFSLYTQGMTRDEDDRANDADHDDPTYKVG
ncbi:MAG: YhcB family protein [Porticoccaceae bacterium]